MPPVLADGVLAQNVQLQTVMKTPQFWALSTTFFCMATGSARGPATPQGGGGGRQMAGWLFVPRK